MSEGKGGMAEAISFGFHLGLSVANVVVSEVVVPTVYGLGELTKGRKN